MFLRPIMTLFLCLAIPALGACGFQPLYAKNQVGETGADPLAAVKIDMIENRVGQLTRNVLLENLTPKGELSSPLYELKVDMEESKYELGFTKENEATVADYVLTGKYRLIRISDTKILRSGSVRARTTYNIVQSDYATLEAESSAREDAARNLARQISNQVAIGIRSAN